MENQHAPTSELPVALQQKAFVTIQEWVKMTGISKSKTYELLKSKVLEAKKVGGRTLIDAQKGFAWLANQPKWTGRV